MQTDKFSRFLKNNNNIGLLFLEQVKTGTAYAESSFSAGL